MTKENVTRANKLIEDIREFEYFLHVIDPSKNVQRGSGFWDIYALFKIQTKKSISIFGSRFIGVGHTKAEIKLPNRLIGELWGVCNKHLEELKLELKNL